MTDRQPDTCTRNRTQDLQDLQDVLDRPVQSKPRLARLLAEKSVLELNAEGGNNIRVEVQKNGRWVLESEIDGRSSTNETD